MLYVGLAKHFVCVKMIEILVNLFIDNVIAKVDFVLPVD